MDGRWLVRARWRRRGAWLWPLAAALTALDAVIGHRLPPSGDSQSWASAVLVACVLNLLAVLVLSWPVSLVVRRARRELPKVVAMDVGGRVAVAAVSAGLLAVGVAHHDAVSADRQARTQAIVRAQAFIGDRAPDEFRRNLSWVSTLAIEPGRIYRTCVPNGSATKTYCVIVDVTRPFGQGVMFSGYEPNSVFSEGTD